MKKGYPGWFRVLLTGRAALKLGRSQWNGSGTVPNFRALIRDDLRPGRSDEEARHVGLIYEIEISAENIFEALESAFRKAKEIGDELSFVHGCAVELPRLQIAIDLDEGNPEPEVVQVLHNVPVFHDPRRVFTYDGNKEFFVRLEGLRDRNGTDAQRIERAMHSYRKSLLDQDTVDQFLDSIHSLESLEPLLLRKFELCGKRNAKCRKCKEELKCQECGSQHEVPDNRRGTDHLITEIMNESIEEAKFLRNMRIKLIHSTEDIQKLRNDLPNAVSLGRRATFAGILFLLGYSAEEIKAETNILRLPPQPIVGVRVRLPGWSVRELATGVKYPQVRLQGIETVKPVSQEVPSIELKPFAVGLNVLLDNYDGEWYPVDARWLMET